MLSEEAPAFKGFNYRWLLITTLHLKSGLARTVGTCVEYCRLSKVLISVHSSFLGVVAPRAACAACAACAAIAIAIGNGTLTTEGFVTVSAEGTVLLTETIDSGRLGAWLR